MNFKELNKLIQAQFDSMCATGQLFRTDVNTTEVWNTYLSSFETKTIFRDPESSEHNCNLCNNFMRRYGNIVAINDDGNLESIFSNITEAGEYTKPLQAIAKLVTSQPIKDIFFETYDELNSLPYERTNKTQELYQLGIATNFKKYTDDEVAVFGVVNSTDVYEFNHFNLQLPRVFVDTSGDSIEQITAHYRDKYSVFKRAMNDISVDTLHLVRDLIKQGSLLDGTAHLKVIDVIENEASKYALCRESDTIDNWLWFITYDMSASIAKFRNTLIGTLCVELSEGMELNKACENWNKRVDPANYHKATAPITQRQIKEAQSFVEDNGYVESFNRRFATIDDIKASEIKHMNIGTGTIPSVSVFDNVKATSTRHKRAEFDKLEEVTIDKFMKDILPSCTSIEAYLENRMVGNLVTMTTSNTEDAKSIFKWSNPYSWTFNGNLAGKSQIKDTVRSKGGKVDGVLRFSIMWAEGDGDNSDLDAHCKQPNGTTIYYSIPYDYTTKGNLDVDITNPSNQMPKGAVENITFPSLNTMLDGTYQFYVYQYRGRSSKGFKAEIEFNGESYYYEYNKPVSGVIPVANVTLKDNQFTIEHKLPESNTSKEIWGIETNNFHKVNIMCLSPNHWDDNEVGNLHYLFMLDKCKADTIIRSFHNENLTADLLKHRKVMEVLGATNMLEPTDKQLSGIGFNATVKDELIVKCAGSFKRMIKIKF